MDDPGNFSPATQQELTAALGATRKTMSAVRENMRIIDAGRNRAENRIRELAASLKEARQSTGIAATRIKELEGELDAQKEESDRQRDRAERQEADQAKAVSSLASAREETELLRSKLSDLMTDRDVLTQKASDIDDILRDKMDLERQLAEAAAAVTVQEEAISGYKTKLTEAGSRTASLQQVVDDKTSEAESLRGQLAQAGETAREFDKQRAEQDGALARRDKALAGLRDEFAQAKALQEEHAAGQVEMGNRVKDLEAQLSTSGEQRNAAKDELGKAAETHRAITEELRQAQEALTRCGEEKGKIQQALDEARRAIEGQTAQLSAEAELRSAMELDLEVSRCALNELKVALVEADREFSHDISSNG